MNMSDEVQNADSASPVCGALTSTGNAAKVRAPGLHESVVTHDQLADVVSAFLGIALCERCGRPYRN